MTDDHSCSRSHIDMSFLVKTMLQPFCKSKDLVNKCSEAVKINCSHPPKSFISSVTDLFNSLSTKRGIIPFRRATVHFHHNDAYLTGHLCLYNHSLFVGKLRVQTVYLCLKNQFYFIQRIVTNQKVVSL